MAEKKPPTHLWLYLAVWIVTLLPWVAILLALCSGVAATKGLSLQQAGATVVVVTVAIVAAVVLGLADRRSLRNPSEPTDYSVSQQIKNLRRKVEFLIDSLRDRAE